MLGSRWPTIMADAAYELVQRNARKCTGNFFIDETLLRETGITDFSHYAVDPNAQLMQDLFIAEENTGKNNPNAPLVKELFTTVNVKK